VPLDDAGDLAEAFHGAHEERYGYADRGRAIELVAVRTAEIRAGPAFDLPVGEPLRVEGPALVELPEATLAAPPGWSGEVLESGTIRLERS
jgi:N-methylhydantoinase A